jgi:hypothetical protein
MKTVQKNKFLHYAFILIAAFAMLVFSAIFSLDEKRAYADVKAVYRTVYVGDSIDATEYTLADGAKAEGLRAFTARNYAYSHRNTLADRGHGDF